MNIYELAAVRTNNFKDLEMVDKIQRVWTEAQRKLREEGNLYGVYHEFESDYKGDYTLSIASGSAEGRSLVIDDKANYRVFPVDRTQEMAVYQTWQAIWALEEQGALKRAYRLDYEKYDVDGSIDIFIEIYSES
ncbi:effector binding domain-containing protein [uncultured Vagococcus sp.]|uniref:effector binding domain-containing protein n=1 Tax=uncultured Vagococcus sp. TaxID=189676 RepID=UPI0028D63AAA|nr:effector binding domain-containing protein [uncultured Vagococcus sp.]